ncbi:rhodanese-like domain-containing protein [Terricaulis sp.]|uniref:rhodanese-like domain-containing protein n=1 Tax=Terricaulis sp. TaxID=2768686 RepID=UPI0037845ECD
MTPKEVAAALSSGEIVLIDVREPIEYAAERIHGALLYPLSTFDPAELPRDEKRPIVFQCGSGKRSETAFNAAAKAGVPLRAHMRGGIGAWKAAGLPVVTIDPVSGLVRDPG